jgi:cation transporter-like permease
MIWLIPISAIALMLLPVAWAIVATLVRPDTEPDNLTKYH